jgi:hypothetical protein
MVQLMFILVVVNEIDFVYHQGYEIFEMALLIEYLGIDGEIFLPIIRIGEI